VWPSGDVEWFGDGGSNGRIKFVPRGSHEVDSSPLDVEFFAVPNETQGEINSSQSPDPTTLSTLSAVTGAEIKESVEDSELLGGPPTIVISAVPAVPEEGVSLATTNDLASAPPSIVSTDYATDEEDSADQDEDDTPDYSGWWVFGVIRDFFVGIWAWITRKSHQGAIHLPEGDDGVTDASGKISEGSEEVGTPVDEETDSVESPGLSRTTSHTQMSAFESPSSVKTVRPFSKSTTAAQDESSSEDGW